MTLGIGRRRLFLCGLSALAVSLFVMGFLGLARDKNEYATAMATGSMMLVWATCYQLSVGWVLFLFLLRLTLKADYWRLLAADPQNNRILPSGGNVDPPTPDQNRSNG